MDSHERADRQGLWPTDQKRTCEPEPEKFPRRISTNRRDSLQHKLIFRSRTTPNIDIALQETENIAKELIPNVVKHPSHDSNHRKIFVLPVKHADLNIMSPGKTIIKLFHI